MSEVFYPDGRAIPANELAQAEAQGLVRFRTPDAEIALTDQFGKPIKAKASEYTALLNRGARLESTESVAARAAQRAEREKFESPTEVAKTFGEGLVRGVPLVGGAAFAGITELAGDEYREAAGKRARYNPGALITGELLSPLPGGILAKVAGKAFRGADAVGDVAKVLNAPGKAASAIAGKLESVAGKAVSPLGTVASKAVGYGAAGAFEAGVYGANAAIAQAALDDTLTELDGEKLWAAFGHGAILGGGAGAIMGTIGAAAQKTIDKLRPKLASEADAAVARSLGLAPNQISKIVKQKGDGTFKRAIRRIEDDPDFRVMGSVDEQAALLAQRQDESLAKLMGVREQLETTASQVAFRRAAQRQLSPDAPQVPGIAPDGQRIVDRVRAEVIGEADSSIAGEVSRRANRSTHRALEHTFLKPIEDALKRGETPKYSDIFGARVALDKKAKFESRTKDAEPFRQARKIFEDEYELAIDQAAQRGAVPSDMYASYKAAKQEFEDYITLRKAVTDRASQQVGRAAIDFSTKVGALAGAGSALAGDMGGFESLGAGLLAGAATKAVGRYQNPIIAIVARKLSEIDERKVNAVASIVKGTTRRAVSVAAVPRRENVDKKFERAAAEITVASQYPDALSEQLTEGLGPIQHTNPRLYAGAVQAMIRANNYLVGTLPKQAATIGESLTPAAEKYYISPLEKRRWLDRYEAVNDPISAYDDIADGTITLDKIEALRETSPTLYDEIRSEVATALAASEKPLPYSRRITLSLAFDLRGDSALNANELSLIQQGFAAQAAGQQSQQGPRASRRKDNTGERMALPSETEL